MAMAVAMAVAKEMPSKEQKMKKKKGICHENLNLRKKDPRIHVKKGKEKKRKEEKLFCSEF